MQLTTVESRRPAPIGRAVSRLAAHSSDWSDDDEWEAAEPPEDDEWDDFDSALDDDEPQPEPGDFWFDDPEDNTAWDE